MAGRSSAAAAAFQDEPKKSSSNESPCCELCLQKPEAGRISQNTHPVSRLDTFGRKLGKLLHRHLSVASQNWPLFSLGQLSLL